MVNCQSAADPLNRGATSFFCPLGVLLRLRHFHRMNIQGKMGLNELAMREMLRIACRLGIPRVPRSKPIFLAPPKASNKGTKRHHALLHEQMLPNSIFESSNFLVAHPLLWKLHSARQAPLHVELKLLSTYRYVCIMLAISLRTYRTARPGTSRACVRSQIA
jgi:hypothetical protein